MKQQLLAMETALWSMARVPWVLIANTRFSVWEHSLYQANNVLDEVRLAFTKRWQKGEGRWRSEKRR